MAVNYSAVLWNRQKKIYDRIMLGLIGLYLVLFILLNVLFFPEITAETLIIRATGSCAIIMLHIILLIGPICRLNSKYLPILYNRRHLGVTMFIIALIHGLFSMIQFHALGDMNPLSSLFLSNTHYGSLVNFPFQTLGFFALLILFLMAATSHDFWLNNLSPKIWKSLHMLVYVAYALLIMHVVLGVIQLEKSSVYIVLLGIGLFCVIGLHLVAAFKEKRVEFRPQKDSADDFVEVCDVNEIDENRAKVILVGDENIAIFKYEGKLSAVHNVCKHQNGPLGEGKIVDGCITCPWHGYQYLPENGQSPPPFKEKVCTYDLKVVGSKVFVNPKPHAEGTAVEPVKIT
ncbi:MAG: ferric reductase-like transmembrane domain-containing protein [Bacteroidetes bacterium]|jgi:nitrite reductase/ring-hydroxylating ferredoxin subunit/DMSO/TMAO reductase YedYZ heme-binding membrane subunit|nr:ferric reductase-like transmembrane domain-containing protein [Bacteroidota bacterium]MDF1863867.1 ferric reductase-like transmembrane domain-containing protein [Saprospiraceae bacterium]